MYVLKVLDMFNCSFVIRVLAHGLVINFVLVLFDISMSSL